VSHLPDHFGISKLFQISSSELDRRQWESHGDFSNELVALCSIRAREVKDEGVTLQRAEYGSRRFGGQTCCRGMRCSRCCGESDGMIDEWQTVILLEARGKLRERVYSVDGQHEKSVPIHIGLHCSGSKIEGHNQPPIQ
jgi:hypothetical protein